MKIWLILVLLFAACVDNTQGDSSDRSASIVNEAPDTNAISYSCNNVGGWVDCCFFNPGYSYCVLCDPEGSCTHWWTPNGAVAVELPEEDVITKCTYGGDAASCCYYTPMAECCQTCEYGGGCTTSCSWTY